MTRTATTPRLVLWVAFAAFCALSMANPQLPYDKLPLVGVITWYELLLLGAALLGAPTLLRVAGGAEPSRARTMCRILMAYLAFLLLLVVPVAAWMGTVKLTAILSTVGVRLTWLLFPVVLIVCADASARRRAATVVVIAAGCLALWGVISAAVGNGGYYLELGEVRYRVLYGGATLLFAFPFVLAASQAVPRRYTIPLLGVSLVGLALTNHRSGMIAFAIAGIVCVWMAGNVRRLVPWLVPVALAATVIGLLWGREVVNAFGYTFSALVDAGSDNGADRLMRWRLAWEFFVAHPFNDYVWSWRYYLVYVKDLYQPHNFLLEIAVTEGVAGLVLYGSLLITALKGALKWGRKDAEARALIGYLIVYLVFVFANASWYLPVNFALLVGGVAALVARVDTLKKAEAEGLPAGQADPREHASPTRGGTLRPLAAPSGGNRS